MICYFLDGPLEGQQLEMEEYVKVFDVADAPPPLTVEQLRDPDPPKVAQPFKVIRYYLKRSIIWPREWCLFASTRP